MTNAAFFEHRRAADEELDRRVTRKGLHLHLTEMLLVSQRGNDLNRPLFTHKRRITAERVNPSLEAMLSIISTVSGSSLMPTNCIL